MSFKIDFQHDFLKFLKGFDIKVLFLYVTLNRDYSHENKIKKRKELSIQCGVVALKVVLKTVSSF